MRHFALLAVVASAVAWADEPPLNACEGNLAAGDACLTEDGIPGTCVEVRFEGQRHPTSPITVRTILICQAAVAGAERRAMPWIGAGLAFLALCAGIATRRKELSVESAA